ncbi:MAG: hypothetical protein KGS72_12245 [Cyanobacteria bacterium REEB67]|nr:hypothetical protein [Cyanobacteria bacterium REEB67]
MEMNFDDDFSDDDLNDDPINAEQMFEKSLDHTPELVNLRRLLRMALKLIDRKFPQESDCRNELYRRRCIKEEPCCKKCGSRNFKRQPGSLSGKCLSCKTVQSLTIGTPFYKLKEPRAFLSMMILLEEGFAFNSTQFANERGIAESSSWAMRLKINMAIADRMEYQDNIAEVSSAEFESVITRRSRVTPANAHPTAEEEAMREACSSKDAEEAAENFDTNETGPKSEATANSQANAPTGEADTNTNLQLLDNSQTLEGLQRKIYDTLSDTPQSCENLIDLLDVSSQELFSALTMLELEGLILRLAGGRYIRDGSDEKKHPEQQQQPQKKLAPIQKRRTHLPSLSRQEGLVVARSNDFTELTEEAIDYIRTVFQGVSRKYLQLYLADFWRVKAHRAGKIPFSIFDVCCQALDTSTTALKAFVSPLLVKIISTPAPAS